MHEIAIIGPIDGLYHLSYETDDLSKFYTIHEFVSKDLAQATANLMNRARALVACDEEAYGR